MSSIAAIVCLVSMGLGADSGAYTLESQSFEERFASPPAACRILKIVHGQPDAPDGQDTLIASLREQGFGGMATNVAFTGYVEDPAKWEALVSGVHKAKAAGMTLWMYDERGYPSGTAGGIVMRDHPEWEARGLLAAHTSSAGGPVSLDVPPGQTVFAAAYPVTGSVADMAKTVDLTANIADRKLTWTAPEGTWEVLAVTEDFLYEGTHAAVSLAYKDPYINLLMPEPTAKFLEVTHAAYAQHLGDDLGQWFTATFTDEPSLMSLFMRPQPYSVIPWSPGFTSAFEQRRGRSITPLLPALWVNAGPETARARYDFWRTAAELTSENFFGQIQTWCRAHNTLSGGHLLMEESLLSHVPLYGDFFRCIRRLDAPSIDCLTSLPPEVPWYIARLISSAAELDGRRETMCEVSDHCQRYRPEGDTRPKRLVTEEEIRGTCNRLILNGITTLTSYYSFEGLTPEQLVRINTTLGRCSTALKGGHQVAGVALLYPIESLWPRFTPSGRWTDNAPASAKAIDSLYRTAFNALYAAHRDFTFVDAQTLAEADPSNGALTSGSLKWRVLILPGADTLPEAAWEKVFQFWQSGGAVIAMTNLPANSDREFPSPRVQEIANTIFSQNDPTAWAFNPQGGVGVFLPPGSEGLLTWAVNHLLEPELANLPADAPLRVTHRRIDAHDVYFVINDSPAPWNGTVALPGHGAGEQWDPATGACTPLTDANAIALTLEAYSGMILRFAGERNPQRCPMAEPATMQLSVHPIASPAPTIGKGEFVRAEMAEDQPSEATGPVWKTQGVLTKTNVDTFLFAIFTYPTPLDLHDASGLVVDTWTPEGQTSHGAMTVILHDTNGVDYLANANRPLNQPGYSRCYLPLASFSRAGWSANAGPIDFTRIAGINIGWGGYFGTENEVITLSIQAPGTYVAR